LSDVSDNKKKLGTIQGDNFVSAGHKFVCSHGHFDVPAVSWRGSVGQAWGNHGGESSNTLFVYSLFSSPNLLRGTSRIQVDRNDVSNVCVCVWWGGVRIRRGFKWSGGRVTGMEWSFFFSGSGRVVRASWTHMPYAYHHMYANLYI
jgi:hypothetical protein